MNNEKTQPKIYTAANLVTIARILLIPAFIIIMLAPWASWMPEPTLAAYLKPWSAAAVFILLAATDGLDGYLARSRGEVTTFGKLLDPLADKILVAAALLALIELGVLPAWIALVILGREFLVSGLRMVAVADGKVIAASRLGKIKTIFQIIAVVTFILKDSLAMIGGLWLGFNVAWYLNALAWFIMSITIIITVASLVDYIMNSADVLGFERKGRWLRKSRSELDLTHDDATIRAISAQVLELAKNQHQTIATAESCTGGLVAGALTEIPGSSEVFSGSVVSYANEIKQGLLGISTATLEQDGAVSEPCVIQMAEGCRARLAVDLAVATSGIAGPDGGSDEKPVGTVWFAVADSEATITRCEHFAGTRSEIREQAVRAALIMLYEVLTAAEGPGLSTDESVQ
ncbi:MAG: CDP-diacylglycerol--glycerol-3-phosphate 3-phosphatidyltransferase [Coriobacteriales bacterium]|jgi:CDP-diacylglycerol--glycerol-3-phosphate 3-phosphatidyltransferase|nr:CDP-diacylglycerol--glycerol-3-phosphate 3-phosphatidyltransferase [Coriobacteriales bacterium]